MGEQVESVRAHQPAQIVTLDKMHRYVGQKNHGRLWVAVCRLGNRFWPAATGSRGPETGQRLWSEVETSRMDGTMMDSWEPYEKSVPPAKHIPSQAETDTVEGYNSLFHHFLARFRRQIQGDSQSETLQHCSAL